MGNEQGNFVPWAGGKGPCTWKMDRYLRATEPMEPVISTVETELHEMTEGAEIDLMENPADLGKGNDLGNKTLW